MGFGVLATKPSEDGFSVWASKPIPKAQYDGDGDPGTSGSFSRRGAWHDRRACVEVKRGFGGCVYARWEYSKT
jgi:hypothetical protein